MTKQTLRNTIINLLDDEHGIPASAYEGLNELCCEYNWNDILDCVDGTDSRYYIGEESAEELRKVVVD